MEQSSDHHGAGAGSHPPGLGDAGLWEQLANAVYIGRSADPHLHTLHAINMIDIVSFLQGVVVRPGPPEDTSPAASGGSSLVFVPAGGEAGLLGRMRRSLLQFLSDAATARYDEALVLARLRAVGLLEEQVVVLHRLGDHTAALQVLAYGLADLDAAVHYCLHHHQQNGAGAGAAEPRVTVEADPGASTGLPSSECLAVASQDAARLGAPPGEGDVTASSSNHCLHDLLGLLLVPPPGQPERLEDALALLSAQAPLLDPARVLAALPGSVPLTALGPYLTRTSQTTALQVQVGELEAAAAASVAVEAGCFWVKLQQRCVSVDERRTCASCRAPFATGEILIVFPNLSVTHYRCQADATLDPERGVPFRNVLQ